LKATGRILSCAAFMLAQIALLYAQQPLVASVTFEGLTHTQPDFLMRYVESKEGSPYDSALTAKDEQRLLNLGILAQVKTTVLRSEDQCSIIFYCKEMINTLPVLTLGQTAETFWCRAGLQSLNLTGRADKLFAYYQYYDRHSVYINYATDRINKSNWGATASLIKWATIEPLTTAGNLVNFNYTNYTGYTSAVRFLSFTETIEAGLGIFNERFEARTVATAEIPSIVQGNKLLSKIIVRSNRLNYTTFLTEGIYNQLNVEFIHALDEVRNFLIVFNDFRYFKKIGNRFNWANRLRVGLSTNDVNPFAPFVLDSYLNIRGVGNRVDRGTGSVVVNSEMRYTVMDGRHVAAQGVGFIDFGTWRKPGGDFADFKKSENMKAFSGLGLRLIYKRAFDTMLRIDYGYDYNKNSGWIIGIGQFF
jgi:outer membrane protein insertion porin family